MKKFGKISGLLGIMFGLVPSMHGIAYDLQCENLFINNKTNHYLLISFCNEDHNEQQQFPMNPKEHRFIKINIGVMKKLFMIKVTITDRKYKKKHDYSKVDNQGIKVSGKNLTREIDYERNVGIVGLEINMRPELDLEWRHEEDYVTNIPEPAVG